MLADKRKTKEEIAVLNGILSTDDINAKAVMDWYRSSTVAKHVALKRIFNTLLNIAATEYAAELYPEIAANVNIETAILVIRYLIMCNKVDDAHDFYTDLDFSMTRKRHAHLVMSAYIGMDGRIADALRYFDIIYEQYNVEPDDVQPFLIAPIPTEAKHYVLDKVIGHPLKFEISTLTPISYIDLETKPIKLDFTDVQRESLMTSMHEIFAQKGKIPEINQDIDYKYIIDGANVLFFADRKICIHGYRRITKMISSLTDGRVLLVLHQRHFKPTGKFKGAAFGEISKWEKNANVDICKTPYGFNDDYYSLINAFPRSNSYLITNDKFRDHIFKLSKKTHSLDLVAQWRQEKIIEYDFDHGKMNFKHPLEYSFRVQHIDSKYYVPNKDALWYVI